MESMNLSLRNLYKVLTKADYPVYTVEIFPPGRLRNLTLVTFWKDMFWTMYGEDADLSVFDTGNGRSRSLSKLLGGMESGGFKAKWFGDLASKLTPERMQACIDYCYGFFKRNNARIEVLEKRLKDYIDGVTSNDALMSKHVQLFLSQLPRQCTAIEEGLVRSSYVFAWLSVYALFSGRTDDPYLNDLKRLQPTIFQMTEKKYTSYVSEKVNLPEVITDGDCVLKYTKLDCDSYFGNEELIQHTVQDLKTEDKLLISGIGGIGKTEFIRQMLPYLIASNRFTHIAYMQYTDSLALSLKNAFPQGAGMTEEKLYKFCETLLCDGRKTLFVIDNLIADKEEKSYLAGLKCCVIASSRMTAMPGFRKLAMQPLSSVEGLQLFSVVSGQKVENDYGETTRVIEILGGHPLLITMIAKICRIKYWSVGELKKNIYRGSLSGLTYVENGTTETIRHVLQQMVDASGLNPNERKLLVLMAMLPTKGYTPAELYPFAKDCCDSEDSLANAMQRMTDYSYLLRTSSGYEMHPAVAEYFLMAPPDADDYPLLWEACADRMENGDDREYRAVIPMIYELLKHTKRLNRTAIRAVVEMESAYIHGSFLYDYEVLKKKHREWLNTCVHEACDEERYWISMGYYAKVMNHYERLNECLDGLNSLDTEILLCPQNYVSLTNMLDNFYLADRLCNGDLIDSIVARIDPGETNAKYRISYLCLLAQKYRYREHNIEKALNTLKQAEKVIIDNDMEKQTSCANVDNRIVFCLADLCRYEETLPYIERCLHVMRINGYTEDSPSLMATRSTYAFMLMSCGRFEDAVQEYESLKRLYHKHNRTATTECVTVNCNLLRCYIMTDRKQQLKDIFPEFRDQMKTIKTFLPNQLTYLVVSVLCHLYLDEPDEVSALIEQAREISAQLPNTANWKAARLEAAEALRLCMVGRMAEGSRLFEQQKVVLEKEDKLLFIDTRILMKLYQTINHI